MSVADPGIDRRKKTVFDCFGDPERGGEGGGGAGCGPPSESATECRVDVGPTSQPVGHHLPNIGSASRVYWVFFLRDQT